MQEMGGVSLLGRRVGFDGVALALGVGIWFFDTPGFDVLDTRQVLVLDHDDGKVVSMSVCMSYRRLSQRVTTPSTTNSRSSQSP